MHLSFTVSDFVLSFFHMEQVTFPGSYMCVFSISFNHLQIDLQFP